ncbi:dUTP diphosphatase [Methylocella sp.]|uniref:dUTP diphosphatase n=1 Tax=Methylocella sp. TaxID=1978226 RepID=UPI003784EE7A
MSGAVEIRARVLPNGEGLPLPDYQSAGAAGLDLLAALAPGERLLLAPGARALVPTGLALALPPTHEAQVRPRSGLALKFGVTVLNAPGTIDSDYRGEVGVLLVNLGEQAFVVSRGDRVAQLVVAPVSRARLIPAASLEATPRGEDGYGSTGTRAQEQAKTQDLAREGRDG